MSVLIEFARRWQLEVCRTISGQPFVKGRYGTLHEIDGEIVAAVRVTDKNQRLRAFKAIKPDSIVLNARASRETKRIQADAIVRKKERLEEVQEMAESRDL